MSDPATPEHDCDHSGFHPAVAAWFRARFPAGPTQAQTRGWREIQRDRHTLIAAPTGSGKTLAAFLCHIDRLYRAAESGTLSDGISVVYVSPLKALVSDIHENLERPLTEIADVARAMGLEPPQLRVGMRTGDSTASQRLGIVKHPPHFLVTTPETLYLMVTAQKSRALLCNVEAVIVDEIHALARDKRGVHLSLTLERLAALGQKCPRRIGLSATQRPLSRIASLLVGHAETPGDECEIVDEGHRRALDLALELPDRELEAVASTEQLLEVADRVAAHVLSHKTTLVFTNTRRLAERFAQLLRERLGDDQVSAHHGSLSKERRLLVETRLRRGELRALVATASLELGIDIGPVELVCQLGSPRSIATLLQRVGRSGHTRFATPKGILYPMTRDELVECAGLLRAVNAGRLDCIVFPEAPLDILAQQIVAECGAETWSEDDLFALVKRAAPYAALSRQKFDSVVSMMSDGIDTGRGKRAAFLHRDGVNGRLRGRRGARLAALTSGGAIPETADYRVVQEPGETFVGTINEDFAIESMAGDVFLLGSTSWRIRRVERGLVRVVDAQGAAPSLPFWLGEAPARTLELSEEVAELRRRVDERLGGDDVASVRDTVAEECAIDSQAAATLVDYLAAARASLGILPTQTDLVFERFFDETGGMQLVVHSPYGARINRGLGLLLRKRFCRSFDFELQAAANDDAIVLSLGPQHSFPLDELRDFLSPKGVRAALTHAVLVTPMFKARWRWNLNRALIVLRRRAGKQNPPQIQRMEADDVMASVFPSLAACQDNATGPREIPDHPIVNQTIDDCMTEAMDAEGLTELLTRIQRGEVRVHLRDTTEPSPLAHEILNGRPYTFLDDAPLEERRTRAVSLRRGLPLQARDLSSLDPEAIERVRSEAVPQLRNAEELHDLLCDFVLCKPRPQWRESFAQLQAAGRVVEVLAASTTFWLATERRAHAALLCPAIDSDTPLHESQRDAVLTSALRAHLDTMGPVLASELMDLVGLDQSTLEHGLSLLQQEGFVLEGRFDVSKGAPQYCSRRLLGRIHAYTQTRLRREIEPVTAQDFMRFLLEFHGVTREHQRARGEGLLAVIEQLQGFETSAQDWEAHLLSARVRHFEPQLLDALCFSGEVTWGRLSAGSFAAKDGWANFGRSTPITLAVRDDFPWLLSAVRGDAEVAPSPHEPIRNVLAVLAQRGALFFNELLSATGLSHDALEEALWDHVARGLLTSDGFSTLRSLLSRRAPGARTPLKSVRTRLRRGGNVARPREGRWALLQRDVPGFPLDDLAEATAEQLLARYGVVFRDLVVRESFTLPWREINWALRRLEARGQIRGGRFVAGFVGEQYALPSAVESLRAVRRAAPSGEVVRLSATDPLNLVGIVVPGERVPAQPGRRVAFRDGLSWDAEAADEPSRVAG